MWVWHLPYSVVFKSLNISYNEESRYRSVPINRNLTKDAKSNSKGFMVCVKCIYSLRTNIVILS